MYYLIGMTIFAIIVTMVVYLYKKLNRKSFNVFATYIAETTQNGTGLKEGKL